MNLLAELQDIHDDIFILGHTEVARKNLINLIRELSNKVVIENGKPTGTVSILGDENHKGVQTNI